MKRLSHTECGHLGGIKGGQAAKQRSIEMQEKYMSMPKQCKSCNLELSYESRRNTYCSQSCAAKFNNKGVRRHGQCQIKPCNICKKPTKNLKYCSAQCHKLHERDMIFETIRQGKYKCTHGRILMKFLIQERGRCCEHCGNDKWLGSPIPLNVHHVDGDATNNLLENLELLCLNCHGLTENYGRKNKNSKRTYRYQAS